MGNGDRRGRRQGLTLLEVTIALAVFVVGAGAAVHLLLGVSTLVRVSEERGLAVEAAQSALEDLQGEEFREAFARFNATAADDPPLGASPGASFAVRGLDPVPGDPDGLPGEILFPGDGVSLREDFADPVVGMPRDLDGDGARDGLDHAGDYRLLPVRVRVSWRGAGGDQQIELAATLSNDKNVP